jgi:hypothetical protein
MAESTGRLLDEVEVRTSPADEESYMHRQHDHIDGSLLENIVENRSKKAGSDDQQQHYESLQTQEAELRRIEEEKALNQGSAMIKQKIRACRHQIFSAMQRLQVTRGSDLGCLFHIVDSCL